MTPYPDFAKSERRLGGRSYKDGLPGDMKRGSVSWITKDKPGRSRMSLPNLSALSLRSIQAEKRRRTRQDSFVLLPSKEKNSDLNLDRFKLDSSRWQEIVVAQTWNGLIDTTESSPYSPDGDWKKRQFVPTAQLNDDGKTCTILSNKYGFFPNGQHRMNKSLLIQNLERHYKNITGFSKPIDMMEAATKTLPELTATTQDIEKWLQTLPRPLWVHEPERLREALAKAEKAAEMAKVAAAALAALASVEVEAFSDAATRAAHENTAREAAKRAADADLELFLAKETVEEEEESEWVSKYRHWKEYVAEERPAISTSSVGRIEYDGYTYVGETSEVTDKGQTTTVPDGLGILKFYIGSSWRGTWIKGQRTSDIGVFTDTDGSVTLGQWLQTSMMVKSTTDMAEEELRLWKEAHSEPIYSDNFIVEKPGYGRIAVASGKVGGVLRMANWHTETAIHRMMKTTNPSELGRGRDADFYMDEDWNYTQLLPLAVFDVDYSNSYVLQDWQRYQQSLLESLSTLRAETTKSTFSNVTRMDLACPKEGYLYEDGQTLVDANLASLGVSLNDSLNEKFLLHATKAENLFAMLNTSFDTTYSSSGLLGKGIYFADDPGKADQYATPESIHSEVCKRLGIKRPQIVDEMHISAVSAKRQAAADAESEANAEAGKYVEWEDTEAYNNFDVFFMFIARVPLGKVLQPKSLDDLQKNISPSKLDRGIFQEGYQRGYASKLNAPYNSLSIKDVLRYREFVVYQNAIARISHLIVYARARGMHDMDEDDLKDLLAADGTLSSDGSGKWNTLYKDPFKAQ
jgi:hypothetical protein